LINSRGLSGSVSVEFASLGSKISKDSVGFIDESFGSLEGRNFSQRMLGKVFRRFDFVKSNSLVGDGEVNESGEEFNFLSSSGLVFRRVEYVAHC